MQEFALKRDANPIDLRTILHDKANAENPSLEAFCADYALKISNPKNLTPADVYFGRGQKILNMREMIKRDTIRQRRFQHQMKAA